MYQSSNGVQSWSSEEVSLWGREVGLSSKIMKILEERAITGDQLLR